MGDAVDEIGLPAVELDFLDGQEEVEGEADQHQREGDSANGQCADGVESGEQDDPADHQRDIECHQRCRERDGPVQRAAFADVVGQRPAP